MSKALSHYLDNKEILDTNTTEHNQVIFIDIFRQLVNELNINGLEENFEYEPTFPKENQPLRSNLSTEHIIIDLLKTFAEILPNEFYVSHISHFSGCINPYIPINASILLILNQYLYHSYDESDHETPFTMDEDVLEENDRKESEDEESENEDTKTVLENNSNYTSLSQEIQEPDIFLE